MTLMDIFNGRHPKSPEIPQWLCDAYSSEFSPTSLSCVVAASTLTDVIIIVIGCCGRCFCWPQAHPLYKQVLLVIRDKIHSPVSVGKWIQQSELVSISCINFLSLPHHSETAEPVREKYINGSSREGKKKLLQGILLLSGDCSQHTTPHVFFFLWS